MIGIISYLPNNEELRKTRKNNHLKQLDWLLNLFPKEKIIIVSQNYNDDDYVKNLNIVYDKYNKGLGPGKARNQLLKQFYVSNDDWLIMMDDDVLSYNYYDSDALICDIYYNYEQYKKYMFDMIIPLMPEIKPFKQFIFEKPDYKNSYVLRKAPLNSCPNLMLLKNLKKYNGVEIFYSELDLLEGEAYSEDLDFLCRFAMKGFKYYELVNWIKRTVGFNESVIFEGTDKESNYALHKELINNFIRKMTTEYNIKDLTEFRESYNQSEDFIIIPRVNEYELPESLYYKPKLRKTKGLF